MTKEKTSIIKRIEPSAQSKIYERRFKPPPKPEPKKTFLGSKSRLSQKERRAKKASLKTKKPIKKFFNHPVRDDEHLIIHLPFRQTVRKVVHECFPEANASLVNNLIGIFYRSKYRMIFKAFLTVRTFDIPKALERKLVRLFTIFVSNLIKPRRPKNHWDIRKKFMSVLYSSCKAVSVRAAIDLGLIATSYFESRLFSNETNSLTGYANGANAVYRDGKGNLPSLKTLLQQSTVEEIHRSLFLRVKIRSFVRFTKI